MTPFARACRLVHLAAAMPGHTAESALRLALVFARTRQPTAWVPRLERQARRAVALRSRWGWVERISKILS